VRIVFFITFTKNRRSPVPTEGMTNGHPDTGGGGRLQPSSGMGEPTEEVHLNAPPSQRGAESAPEEHSVFPHGKVKEMRKT